MASRNELAIRARAVGLNPNSYTNDSRLEQKLLWLEKNATAFTGTLASGTLTNNGTQSANGDMVTIGGVTYALVTALTEAYASTTLTSTGTAPSDGDSVSIEGQTYTFRTTLTNSGTAPYEVLINGSAANSLTNLKAAINATGTAGTTYGTGTMIHPLVNATTLGGTTLVVVSNKLGIVGNNYLTNVNVGLTMSWTGVSLAGGVDRVVNQVLLGVSVATEMANLKSAINAASGMGTTYSTGTGAHPQVTATSTGTTVVVTSIDYAVTNTSIVTTVPVNTGTVNAWGSATLTGGVDLTVVVDATTSNGSGGVSGDRDV